MVIDVIHPGQDRVGGQHRGGEQALQRDRVGAIGDRGQLRPDGPQVRQHRQPGQRPGIGGGQVLELLEGRCAQREAHADRRQQRHVTGLRARRGGQDLAGPGPAAEGVQQHRARIPGRDLAGDARPGCRRAITGPAMPASAPPGGRARPGLRRGFPPRPGPRRGLRLRLRLRRGSQIRRRRWLRRRLLQRQLALRAGGAEPPQHGGLIHPQAAGDLRIADPRRPPFPRPLPRARIQLARPAPRPDHPAGPLPQRPVMQRRHVVHRQAHHRGHRLPAIAQLPQHRHRHVPRPGIPVRVPEQQPRPGEDQRLAVRADAAQVPRVRHALQDGSRCRHHTGILPEI